MSARERRHRTVELENTDHKCFRKTLQFFAILPQVSHKVFIQINNIKTVYMHDHIVSNNYVKLQGRNGHNFCVQFKAKDYFTTWRQWIALTTLVIYP